MTVTASRLRIATRGSPQARTQAEVVARSLEAAHPGLVVDLVLVDTMGDRRQDVPLHTIGGQGVFVKEVQRAVLDGGAELAVHSAKDLPSDTASGLRIGAFCERRSPADALIGRALHELQPGATVATGSVRRRAQLAAVRPDLTFVELRGNIQTRLGKVPEGGSIVMAVAALEVLDLTHLIADELDPQVFVPAIGQGCVAVECGDGDEHTATLLRSIDHGPTRDAVTTERAFLATLGSGCSLPVGAHVMAGRLHAFLADPVTGRSVRRDVPVGAGAVDTARDVAVAMQRELDGG
ncbi:MAG: hydroxymethylbilane synthase [Actinobacteria bacterium]|nr:hydroxymethylbilane synthase [Actinomycetota bacterium]